MEELKPNKEIPNIVNVDDIQEIIDTNRILQDRINKAIKHCKSNMFVDSQFMEEQLEILGYKEDIEFLGDIEEE